jgi:hypothetical protein
MNFYIEIRHFVKYINNKLNSLNISIIIEISLKIINFK